MEDQPHRDVGGCHIGKILAVQKSGACWDTASGGRNKLLHLVSPPVKNRAQYEGAPLEFGAYAIIEIPVLTHSSCELRAASSEQGPEQEKAL